VIMFPLAFSTLFLMASETSLALPKAVSNLTFLITDHDQGGEGKPSAPFDHLSDPVQSNKLFNEFFFS
jgi:hypothetical protein